ncbi:MAG: ATP-binding protein [Balneolaceae bacterium]|nr:ATP-binding protein [Balneolaceae bacterium]
MKPRIQKITKNIIAQIQSLNNIASDFSKFSQPITKDFENVSINELIKSVSNLYEHDDQTDIVTELTAHNLIVEGVDDELRRVIVNLIKNAFEAMPNGGVITVRCYTHKQSVFIEVIDDGVGIPEEDKSRIFVPNFSTKSSGTGTGLQSAREIVESPPREHLVRLHRRRRHDLCDKAAARKNRRLYQESTTRLKPATYRNQSHKRQ